MKRSCTCRWQSEHENRRRRRRRHPKKRRAVLPRHTKKERKRKRKGKAKQNDEAMLTAAINEAKITIFILNHTVEHFVSRSTRCSFPPSLPTPRILSELEHRREKIPRKSQKKSLVAAAKLGLIPSIHNRWCRGSDSHFLLSCIRAFCTFLPRSSSGQMWTAAARYFWSTASSSLVYLPPPSFACRSLAQTSK